MPTNTFSPVALFVFNRPLHTQNTLDALLANELAHETDLVIYADASKSGARDEKVEAVKKIIYSVVGFKSITIIERESNYGLARNIIEGVTAVCEKYGQAIVLEDDIVTSPAFLRYMNNALNFYQNTPKIWHISGWNYPINPTGLQDTFLWREMSCWGWGTWQNRWQHYKKDPLKLIESFTKEDIKKFNLDGNHNFWSQVTGNLNGTMNTWAIFWYATIFLNDGLCLNPTTSLVTNIGFDNSGGNCTKNNFYYTPISTILPTCFSSEHIENKRAVNRIKRFYKLLKIKKIIALIKKTPGISPHD